MSHRAFEVRLALLLPERPSLRPYLGVYYTAVPGFDTLVRGGYSGLSMALGVELGLGL
ncbi:MAG TPA: hypothetical protein VHP33_20040 [Polyangiaceae bacterium]|nr:hypothetical protein [Polyangiaceae bacterium]